MRAGTRVIVNAPEDSPASELNGQSGVIQTDPLPSRLRERDVFLVKLDRGAKTAHLYRDEITPMPSEIAGLVDLAARADPAMGEEEGG